MPDDLALPLRPAWLGAQWRSLAERDPYLDQLRWRLNLRLQLLVALVSAGYFLLNLWNGRVDEVGLLVLASLGAWAYLRTRPQRSRVVARCMLGALLAETLYATFGVTPSAVEWSLPTLMALTVFGTLLDGMQGGGVVVLFTLALGGICLAGGITNQMPLVVAFSVVASICLYFTCLAHTWLFHQLLAHQRESGEAVAATTRVAEQLASSLDQDVAKANARLRAGLAKGLGGLAEARELQAVLASARGKLPLEPPRNAVEPGELLDGLQRSVHHVVLGLGLASVLAATVLILWFRMPFWQLSFLIGLVIGGLLLVGDRFGRHWRWRLYLFVGACLLAFGADVWASTQPPTASLVFLPLLVFFTGMLAPLTAARIVSLIGVALLAWSHQRLPDMPGLHVVLVLLGILILAMLAMSQAAAAVYGDQLASMRVEEDRLRQSLAAYRRVVSTLFHDLANPLAVLQTLAALPPELLTSEDGARASRMLQRLESVAGRNRLAAPAPGEQTSVAFLVDELLDLFRERLEEKHLGFELVQGADIILKRGGGLLRDLMLGHLLSNAVKYSPGGTRIRLNARLHDGWLTLSLHDQGSGYPADVLRDVAEGRSPFVRPGSLGELGNGYGLLEASASARELGGHLTLRNHAEGGAEAELWLPQGQLEN